MKAQSGRWGKVLTLCAASLVASLACPRPGMAQVIINSGSLPPVTGQYTFSPVTYTNGVAVTSALLGQFTNINNNFGGGNETDTYNALLSGTSNAIPPFSGAVASVTQVAFGRTSASATGTFATEMLALNISGGGLPAGVLIRESPTLASVGQTTVASLGGGLFQITSFFNVFTELSVDGGATWAPSATGASNAVLTAVPEPGSLALAGLAVGLCVRRRRKK